MGWCEAWQLPGDRRRVRWPHIPVWITMAFFLSKVSAAWRKNQFEQERQNLRIFFLPAPERGVKTEECGEEGNCSLHFIHEGPSPLHGKPAGSSWDWSSLSRLYVYIMWNQDRVFSSLNYSPLALELRENASDQEPNWRLNWNKRILRKLLLVQPCW